MDILTILYTVSGFVVAAAFIPQIIKLLDDDTGAGAMSLLALAIFANCTLIGFLYACFNNGDVFMMLDYGLCATGEFSVLFLASIRRFQHSNHYAAGVFFSLLPRPVIQFANRI